VSAMHMQLLHNDRVILFDRTNVGPSNLTSPGPALCFLGPGAKPKLEAPNKQNLPTSLYQLQSLFRCIIKKILMVKTIAYKYIKSITGIPNLYLLNR